MKQYMLVVLLCATSICFAQEDESGKSTTTITNDLKPMKNEIGIIDHVSAGIFMPGIQYRHWKDDRKAIRFIAAYGQYIDNNSTLLSIKTDTVFSREADTHINLGILGAGLDVQRHFYRNMYLYAALELRGGYGSGHIDTSVTRQYKENNAFVNTGTDPFRNQNVNMLYFGFNPSIGIKAQRRHLAAGIELMPVNISYKKITGSGSLLDMSMFNFESRIFASYRF